MPQFETNTTPHPLLLVAALRVVALSLSFLYFAELTHAAPPLPVHPRICTGFVPDAGGGTWGESGQKCPAGFGIFGTRANGGSTSRPGSQIGIVAACCPLPSDDIFESAETSTVESCPEDSVATGGDGSLVGEPGESDKPGGHPMTCRRINTARYKLGPARPGGYWGFGSTYWQQSQWLLKRDIPASIRSAFGRVSQFAWLSHGCVGVPFGSLLTAKSGKRCDQKSFRQLQYRGLPDDPPEGTPVEMFPACESISDIYSASPDCVMKIPEGSK